MNISQAAQACGLPSKTIRFYEEVGLVVPARQAGNDYRIYSLADIEQLRLLQRARAVGFGLDECRELLALYLAPQRRDGQVKALLEVKIRRLDQQFIALNVMRASLQAMVDQCLALSSDVAEGAAVRKKPEKALPAMAFTLIDAERD